MKRKAEAADFTMNQTKDRRATGMYIASMLIFGTIGIFRRFLPLPSSFLAFARGILGGLFLLVLVRLRRRRGVGRMPPGLLLRFAFIGALIGFNWMLLFEAFNYTTVARATLCYYMQPTIVILLSPLVFRERLTGKKILCALLSVIGMVLISGVLGESGGQGASPAGILLGLGAAALYACIIILNKKSPAADPYQKTTVQLLTAGIVMAPYLLLAEDPGGLVFSASSLLLLLVIGIVHTGVAYALYFSGMDGMKVQSIAVLSYIDPVSALAFSALLLREPLSPIHMLGAALILGSAVMSEIRFGNEGQA